MKLKDMDIQELELMSYADITYKLLKENNKTMTTPVLFRAICDLLEFTDSEYENKIGDYYTSLTIDKRFVMLSNNEWDIRDNHSIELVIDEDDEEENLSDEEEIEDEIEELDNDEENIDDINDDEDLDDDDDMDLSIVSDEELEDEEN